MPLTLHCGRFRWSATWSMTLLTAVAVCAFIGLGRWQWHRADQKRALQEEFSAGARAARELGAGSTEPLARYTRLRVIGRYDAAHQFLLDNMSHAGFPGYEVLTPLVRTDGRAILVNRGWVPMPPTRQALPAIGLDASDRATEVTGLVDSLPVAALSMGHVPPSSAARWPKRTSFPTAADLSAALGRPIEPRQLLLEPDEPNGYVRDWRPAGFGPAQHLSYAVQWWLFAAVAVVLYAFLNRQRVAT